MRAKTLALNVDPFSINRLHYRDGKIKTAEARNWECTVFYELAKPENQVILAQLRSIFDPKLHSYYVKLVCKVPKTKFFNKQGTISAKTMDISNWEKPLIDLIFLDRYSEFSPPFGVKNLKTDDRFITCMRSEKQFSELSSNKILVTIKILPLKTSQ